MRAFFLGLLLLSACATAPQNAESFRIAGCWANREQPRVETMAWRTMGDTLEGELIAFEQGDPVAQRNRFTLARAPLGWQLCEATVEGAPCWLVAYESAGSLEGGRAFIDQAGDRLRIGVIMADGGERKIFEGEREACPA